MWFFFLFQFGVYWSFGFAVCLRQCRQCCQHRHLFRSQSLSKMSGFGSQNARWILQSYDLRSLWRWILLVVYERNLRFALLKPIRYNNKSFLHVLSTYLLMQNPSKIPIFPNVKLHDIFIQFQVVPFGAKNHGREKRNYCGNLEPLWVLRSESRFWHVFRYQLCSLVFHHGLDVKCTNITRPKTNINEE